MFILHRLVQTVIEPMAKDGLRTISLAYRDFVPTKAEKNQVICSGIADNISEQVRLDLCIFRFITTHQRSQTLRQWERIM